MSEHPLDALVAYLMTIVGEETPMRETFDFAMRVTLGAYDDQNDTDKVADITRASSRHVGAGCPRQAARRAIAAAYDVLPGDRIGDTLVSRLAELRASCK